MISKFWVYTKEMFSKVFFSNPNLTGVKFTVQKVRITGILEFFTMKELGFPIMQLKIFLGDFCINQLGFGKFSEFFTFKSLIFRVCILFLSFFGNHWVFLFLSYFSIFSEFPQGEFEMWTKYIFAGIQRNFSQIFASTEDFIYECFFLAICILILIIGIFFQ